MGVLGEYSRKDTICDPKMYNFTPGSLCGLNVS